MMVFSLVNELIYEKIVLIGWFDGDELAEHTMSPVSLLWGQRPT
jgi:hypothetical protein